LFPAPGNRLWLRISGPGGGSLGFRDRPVGDQQQTGHHEPLQRNDRYFGDHSQEVSPEKQPVTGQTEDQQRGEPGQNGGQFGARHLPAA